MHKAFKLHGPWHDWVLEWSVLPWFNSKKFGSGRVLSLKLTIYNEIYWYTSWRTFDAQARFHLLSFSVYYDGGPFPGDSIHELFYLRLVLLRILAHFLRMVSWNLNTFRFGSDYTPLAHHLRFGDWILRGRRSLSFTLRVGGNRFHSLTMPKQGNRLTQKLATFP